MDVYLVRNRIKDKRKELGYTQEYMAGRLNISLHAYGELESGKTKIMNMRVVEVSKILGESLEYILFGANDAGDYEEMLKQLKEEFQSKIENMQTQHQIKMQELEGTIAELRIALQTKEGIIGVLKEKLPNY